MLDIFMECALQNVLFVALHLDNCGSFPRQLTREEEQSCIARLAAGDADARNELIEHNLRLVAYIVKKRYSDSREQEDLISIGTIGLIRAAETFDGSKQINFSTYASKCIENQILMYFRKNKKLASEVFMYEPVDVDKDGNAITIADIFSDTFCLADEAELRVDMEKLYIYVNSELDEREKQILCKRFGLNTTTGVVEKAMTQKQVAKQLGISRSYVSRIEKRAMDKLRAKFEEEIR